MSAGHAGSCHCGAVRLAILDTPVEVTQCNCTLCTKLGTRWVYAPSDRVTVSGGPLDDYVRGDLKEPALTTRRCRTCGTIICWQALDPQYARMGINANLLDPALVEGLPVRHVNGRDWNG
jgi:hypothetical protein